MAGESRSGWLAGLAPGAVLAGYRLEARIGAGGMAVVFRAIDERLGRTVALKVLASALAGDGEFRERFVRESRAAATVDHPHIIPVYGAGEADGILFLAMRYVPGATCARGTVSDPGGSGVRSLAINAMGTQLAVADKNGTTYVWNLPS